MSRSQHRLRRVISPGTARLIRPFFRLSVSRDAYILRGIGGRYGPVLQVHHTPPENDVPAERPSQRTGRFERSERVPEQERQ